MQNKDERRSSAAQQMEESTSPHLILRCDIAKASLRHSQPWHRVSFRNAEIHAVMNFLVTNGRHGPEP
jgi:hypothetical protein